MSYSISELQKIYNEAISGDIVKKSPKNLYEPLRYILELGGKRIRPVLVLLGYNLYKEDVAKALPMAHAVEFFHNFSLMHDDIMDDAKLRRGHQTVHLKYDLNTAILSGDIMLINAYQFIEQCEASKQIKLFSLFNTTSRQVCEGQQMDIDFENRTDVSIEEYLQMITYKTAVLLGASMQYGAILAGAKEQDAEHLYNFGINMGIAFQVQDDILDTFALSKDSGKLQGGDIIQRKKTYLYLKSLELLGDEDSSKLRNLFTDENVVDEKEMVQEVTKLFMSAHVKTYAEELKLGYQQLALSHLAAVNVVEDNKTVLKNFANKLLDREK